MPQSRFRPPVRSWSIFVLAAAAIAMVATFGSCTGPFRKCGFHSFSAGDVTAIVFSEYHGSLTIKCTDREAIDYLIGALRGASGSDPISDPSLLENVDESSPPGTDQMKGEPRRAIQSDSSAQQSSRAFRCSIHFADGSVCEGLCSVFVNPPAIMFKPRYALTDLDPSGVFAEFDTEMPLGVKDVFEALIAASEAQ